MVAILHHGVLQYKCLVMHLTMPRAGFYWEVVVGSIEIWHVVSRTKCGNIKHMVVIGEEEV